MFDLNTLPYIITFFVFILMILLFITISNALNFKRNLALSRLKNLGYSDNNHISDESELMSMSLKDRTIGVLANKFINKINNIAPYQLKEEISEKLEKAGNPQNMKASDFLGLQIISGFTTFIITWSLVGIQSILLILIMVILAFYIPWFILSILVTKRQQEIQQQLPDVVDLLVISIESGLGFDQALAKVVEKYPGALGKELQQVLRDMSLGKTRKDALSDMAERVGLEDLELLVNALVQSDNLGVGIGKLLRIQSDLIREKRQQRIEAEAMRIPIKMLFPLVFMIFPCMFIIILGPAILNIIKALG